MGGDDPADPGDNVNGFSIEWRMESLAITIGAIHTLFVNELNATGHECGHAV
jgi:hypothetical protein